MFFFFFFSSRRRHTRSLRDWSSDVCSSDLYVSDESANTVTIYGPPTIPGPPFVQSESATDVTQNSVTLHAAIVPFGFDTTCQFQYVDDATFQASGYTTATSVACVPADLGASFTVVQASASVSGLASTTIYHFRVVVANSAGTTNGADKTFQTAGAPSVVSESASNLTDTGATLNATIIPSGFDTTCQFQYVNDAAFQASGYNTATSVDCSPFDLGSSFDPQNTSANVTGLKPNTIYHFRVVATNAAGTTNGADKTFQTLLSFLVQGASFGSAGSGAGQFQTPVGVAIQQSSGGIYVADSGNARVQKFNAKGQFVTAFGWGVANGQARSQVCSANCQAGIAGSGPGQFSNPTSIAFGNATGAASAGKLFVGDAGNNVVVIFDGSGNFLSSIDGSTTPQGHFVSLAGVAVDASGNLWTADSGTGNVDEFDPKGNFLQQWSDPSGTPQAIAVDAPHNAVYLLTFGTTARFTLTGGGQTTIDSGSGTALALDPQFGNLYVDHGHDVAVYDPAGTQIDTLFSLSAGVTTNSQGLAFRSSVKNSPGALSVSDASNNTVTIYAPPPAGPPFITSESFRFASTTSDTLKASIVPLGFTTTCTFQFVGSADFAASGYTNATTIPCTPASLGSSFDYQQASALVSGLTVGAFYHFRVVATNSAGTTTGADQTFQAGPGAWTPFSRCPVDDPAMLAADGVNVLALCVASNSTHGSIKIGNTPTTDTGNSNLQGGLLLNNSTSTFTFIAPPAGALVGNPVNVTISGLTAIATVESAGTPTDFNLIAGLSLGVPIVTLPTKIHLVSQTPVNLGPTCFIGSEQDPMVLHPANTDISNAMLSIDFFDADGTPNPNGALAALVVAGTVQGDSTFAVPVAQGCGGVEPIIDSLVGLPSPSGSNHLVLDDASSSLALPNVPLTGQQFAAAWHTAFGATPPTTTTTTTTIITTTTTISGTTTTTLPGAPPTLLDFSTSTPGGTCGTTVDGSNALIKNLTCGGLNLGGGADLVPEGPIPDGSTSRFALSCTGASCTIGPTSTTPPVNTAGPDCTATGCNFGTPLPIPSPTIPAITTCVLNTWSAAASGTLDLAGGTSSTNVALSSDVYLTGNLAQPCPKCSATGTPSSPGHGTCDRGPRATMACTTTSSTGYTRDCPTGGSSAATNCGPAMDQPCTCNAGGGFCLDGSHVGPINVNLSPLSTGTSVLTDPGGNFCPGQSNVGGHQFGCF